MKSALLFISFLLLPVITGYSMSGEKMRLVEQGAPNATIIIPESPTSREQFAAAELQKYIQQLSGGVLPIVSDTTAVHGNVILIGGPQRNARTKQLINITTFDQEVPGPEGLMIRTFGKNTLVLAGSTANPNEKERGTLYAVYEFLERFLGCSFVAYGKPGTNIGEYIPHRPTLAIGAIQYSKPKADLPYRTAIVQYYKNIPHDHQLSISFIDWLSKNRYNRILTMASVYEDWKTNGLLAQAKKRGIQFTVGHHESSLLFLPPHGNRYFPEAYYETHPEYYKLLADGTRYDPETIWHGQWVFNSRNENAIEQVAKNIKTWFSKNPYVDIVCLWPCDRTAPQCQDSLCQGYSKTENYAYFVNEVAKKVSAVYPYKKIDMLIYHDLWAYPGNLDLDASLVIDQANIRRSYDKAGGSSLIGTKYERNAKAWAAAGAKVVYYEYYMGVFSRHQVYFPMADMLDTIYRHFKADGYCQGVGTQIECHNVWNFLLNFYVHGRTAYNTDLTISDNLERFCKIFGKGAPYIRAYFKYIAHFFQGQGGSYPGRYFMQNVNKEKIYSYFEDAYQAEPEGRLRNNIRMLRMAFRYSDLYTNGGNKAELKYMYDNFDSFVHNPGYGIAIIYKEDKAVGKFIPGKWYEMFTKGEIDHD